MILGSAAVLSAALLVCGAPALQAQDGLSPPESASDDGTGGIHLPRSPVLMIDTERMFSQSRFGQELAQKVEAQANALAAENRKLEAELADEEQKLTDERSTMDPAKFRTLADAFDKKVTRIRREREEKAKDLGQDSDAARKKFLSAAQPVLNEIMRRAGAAIMLDRRSVFLGRESVDVTDAAVAMIDASLAPVDNAAPDASAAPAAPEAGSAEQFGKVNPDAAPAAPAADPGDGPLLPGQGKAASP
ncbi:OmpH family outer membrane protein [Pseudooceanicola sp. CBS1P-1]|uniref:OmpH family outer membrane protein n=1 Tax=Pseudooceanicola albus TaxID=2692189 RepID=A0A6L7FXK8_9RHOB|nr:OmpH family outer membrane protein [Pseudooceanicola endophyticus]MBT9383182.1 OmpH family outer membrane protein [Pseudooceanicola endophyticus]MXN16495.1 OmpH family outer membrane protein [Pseudooceanicola albus]